MTKNPLDLSKRASNLNRQLFEAARAQTRADKKALKRLRTDLESLRGAVDAALGRAEEAIADIKKF